MAAAAKEIRWDELQEVRIRSQAGADEGDSFTLELRGDSLEHSLPLTLASTDLIARLQELPGFDNSALFVALSAPRDAELVCWSRQAREAGRRGRRFDRERKAKVG